MNGPWHYKEAERLGQLATDRSERLAKKAVMVASQAEVEQRAISQLIALAQVHATLAVAASNTVHAFFDDDAPDMWAQAFANGTNDVEAVETAEQAAAIVDANLSQMGVTLGGEAQIFDGQQGRMQQDYKRNRAQGRDQVESAARAMLGLT